MPFVDIEDSRVDYRVDGDGPGLVLVHGSGLDADSNWGSFGDRLSTTHTVVRPNYSGSGETVDEGGPLTLERLGRQVVASAWAARAAPFDLVGFGLGAAVAAYVAATMPDLVRSLTLIAGFPDANDPILRLQLRLRRDLAGDRPDILARLMLQDDHGPGYLARISDAQISHAVRAIAARGNRHGMIRQLNLELGLNLQRVLPGIACPALVVAGDQDRRVPPAHTLALIRGIRRARTARLATGHLSPLEAPQALASLLEEFVAEPRAAAV